MSDSVLANLMLDLQAIAERKIVDDPTVQRTIVKAKKLCAELDRLVGAARMAYVIGDGAKPDVHGNMIPPGGLIKALRKQEIAEIVEEYRQNPERQAVNPV